MKPLTMRKNLVEPEHFHLALNEVAQVHDTAFSGFAPGRNDLTAQIFSTKPGCVDQQGIIQDLPLFRMTTVLFVHEAERILASVICNVSMQSAGNRTKHAIADFQIE
jgi:hypothetical protein